MNVFDEKVAAGRLSNQAYHPDRPDNWELDSKEALKPSCNQEGTRQSCLESGMEPHDGILYPTDHYGNIRDKT